MNGFDIDEGALLQRLAGTKQLEIERLLREYSGEKAHDVHEYLPTLQGLIGGIKTATQPATEPIIFSAAEANQLGLSVQEGWQLKLVPQNGSYVSSFITPQNWEITEGGLYISPEGKEFTTADMEALLSMPTGLFPEAGFGAAELTPESLTEEGRRLYQEYQAVGGKLDVAGWLDLREKQQLETEQVFGAVFPQQDIREVIDYIQSDPQGFLADLREIGWTQQSENLLRYLFPDITTEDLLDIFQMSIADKVGADIEGIYYGGYQPEGFLKDYIWDPLVFGATTFVQGLKTAFTTIYPSIIYDAYANSPLRGLLNISAQVRGTTGEDLIQTVMDQGEARLTRLMTENRDWLQQHPELTPNPVYLESPFEHPELLKDPAYWAYSVTSSLAYSLAVMGTIVAVSAVATPAVGIPVGFLLAGAPEAASMTEELVNQGVPFEEAIKWGGLYGMTAGGIETITDLPLIGLMFKPLKTATQPFWKVLLKGTSSRLATAIRAGLTIPQIEGLEEVVTQVAHNAILKQYDQTASLLDGLSHAYIQGVIASTPFGIIGGQASYRTFRASLSQETGQKYDDTVERLQEKGLTQQEAQFQAANEIAKANEEEISKALEAAQAEYWEQQGKILPSQMIEVFEGIDVLRDIEVAQEVRPDKPEGTPMPGNVQAEFIDRARSWLQEVPDVSPSSIYTVPVAGGEAFIRTDSKGDIAIAAVSLMREGRLTLSTVVGVKRKGLGFGKAGLDLINYIEQNNIALPPTIEMSPDALRAYEKYLAKKKRVEFVEPEVSTTEAGMPEAGYQPSLLEEVKGTIVRPEGRGKIVQIQIDDYLRLQEYNEKAGNDRIEQIKKILETKGRTPEGEANKGNLRIELARLEALQEIDAVESIADLDTLIRDVETELGRRSLHLKKPNLFPDYTSRQLEEQLRLYQEARGNMPEGAALPAVIAQDIPIDIPALTNTQLSPNQIQKTIDLFKEAVAAPNTELQRAAALELRKHVFAQRAASASESAQAMIAEGMNPEEAIKAAEQMFMTGKLPDVTTDYFDDLTQEMRNVLFGKLVNYWKDKPNGFTELMSGHTALTNALAGKSIPRERGKGTQSPYFPEGGSAWDRLARVFIGEKELLEVLDQGKSLRTIIEGVYLQTGRGSVQLDQGTVDWLKELSRISEEDKLLLSKPLSELTQADVQRIAKAWFWRRKGELDTQLRDGVISEQEYKLELAMAKDRVFPYRPIAATAFYPPAVLAGQARLGEQYVPPTPIEEKRTEAELRLKREAMEAEAKLAEAKLKRGEFQPVVIDPVVNEVFEQAPMFTLRERQTISRVLKALGWAVTDINNLIRGIMASFDTSFPRQGKYLMCGHPHIAYSMGIAFWKSRNAAEAEAMQQRIMQDPLMELYEDIRKEYGYDFLRVMGVKKGTAQWRAAEEYGYPTAERLLPRITQKATAPFERIFASPLNVGSWILYKDKYKEVMRYAEKVASGKVKLKEGKSVNIREEMATYQMQIGNLVQRASLGQYNQLGPILNTIFFAARSKLARFLFPLGLTGIYRRGGEWHFSRGLMKETWRDFMITNSLIAGVVLFGDFMDWWEAEKDPRNAEFMSIRIGNLRIDPWAGYRQFVVLYARLATGTGVSSVTGAEYESDPIRTLTNFLRGSLAPVPGILWDFWTGRNFLGVVVDLTNAEQWIQRIAPFAVQDIWEAFDEGTKEGMIAIIPAIFGEGVQTYTGDWRENWAKIGLPKYPENTGYGIYEPIYDLADFWADTAPQFRGVDPTTLTESKGYPEYVRSIAQALQVMEQIESLPNQRLININADPEKGATFREYYQMWQAREKLVASGDEKALEEFDQDERTRNAYLGNMTQAQYSLLVEYHSLPEGGQAEFLGKHPELYANPREEWLRTHPEENALLALWLDPDTHGIEANVYSLEALNKIGSLAKSLGIPENAMFDREMNQVTELKIKHANLFDLWDAYGGLDDTIKDAEGLTARDRARLELSLANPDFVDDMRRIEALSQGTEDNPTPQDIVESWVARGWVVDEYGASSSEAKLWLIDNRETHQWALDHALLSDTGEDWNEPILRLLVQHGEDFDLYDAYGDMSSDSYIKDDTERAAARERMLFENGSLTQFGQAYYTRQAASEGYSEAVWGDFVDYSSLPTWGSWRERFLLDNLAFYQEYTDPNIGNHPLVDESDLNPLVRDNIYKQFYDEFQAWDDTGGLSKIQIENMREDLLEIEKGGLTFSEARDMVAAYDMGVPEKYIELYAQYYQLPAGGYEQEWFFMDHPDYYRDVWRGVLGNQEKDFSKVPTKAVWALYQEYLRLPTGNTRLNFRAQHPELDDWLVKAKGLVPIGDRAGGTEPSSEYQEEYREQQIAQDLLEQYRSGVLTG